MGYGDYIGRHKDEEIDSRDRTGLVRNYILEELRKRCLDFSMRKGECGGFNYIRKGKHKWVLGFSKVLISVWSDGAIYLYNRFLIKDVEEIVGGINKKADVYFIIEYKW